jgi:hypothetical protein
MRTRLCTALAACLLLLALVVGNPCLRQPRVEAGGSSGPADPVVPGTLAEGAGPATGPAGGRGPASGPPDPGAPPAALAGQVLRTLFDRNGAVTYLLRDGRTVRVDPVTQEIEVVAPADEVPAGPDAPRGQVRLTSDPVAR